MKRILINKNKIKELKIALLNENWLYDLNIETLNKEQKISNIYKGKVTRIEPSLNAAFIDYGNSRHGFLPLKEISFEYIKYNIKNKKEINDKKKVTIKEILSVGDELIVQINKEERSNKGASLTTFISLAGCYLVLMPNSIKNNNISVSKKINNHERKELQEIINKLKIPKKMNIIIRTAGADRSIKELEWNLNMLISQWGLIKKTSNEQEAPFLIYQENNVIIKIIREYLKPDINEIIIDSIEIFDTVKNYINIIRPDFIKNVKLYEKKKPIFDTFNINNQINSAFEREIKLPSGGLIIIDQNEALTSIDINSSKATQGKNIEETALQTNLEAADEISRQIRIRDLGGLIVIDFIDMNNVRNQKLIEQQIKNSMSIDRAKIQVSNISQFGLMEISRQRIKNNINEMSKIKCPNCNGKGVLKNNKKNISDINT